MAARFKAAIDRRLFCLDLGCLAIFVFPVCAHSHAEVLYATLPWKPSVALLGKALGKRCANSCAGTGA